MDGEKKNQMIFYFVNVSGIIPDCSCYLLKNILLNQVLKKYMIIVTLKNKI